MSPGFKVMSPAVSARVIKMPLMYILSVYFCSGGIRVWGAVCDSPEDGWSHTMPMKPVLLPCTPSKTGQLVNAVFTSRGDLQGGFRTLACLASQIAGSNENTVLEQWSGVPETRSHAIMHS